MGNSSSTYQPMWLNMHLREDPELKFLRLQVIPAQAPNVFSVLSKDAEIFKKLIFHIAEHSFSSDQKDHVMKTLQDYYTQNDLDEFVEIDGDGRVKLSLYLNGELKFSSSDSCEVGTPWLSFKKGKGSGWYQG